MCATAVIVEPNESPVEASTCWTCVQKISGAIGNKNKNKTLLLRVWGSGGGGRSIGGGAAAPSASWEISQTFLWRWPKKIDFKWMNASSGRGARDESREGSLYKISIRIVSFQHRHRWGDAGCVFFFYFSIFFYFIIFSLFFLLRSIKYLSYKTERDERSFHFGIPRISRQWIIH